LQNSILTPQLWTWLELDKRNQIRRAICVSYALNVFSTPTWDHHIVPICLVVALHHAHPRWQTTTRLCFVFLEADVVPICNSTSQFVSHQSSSKWIHANKKFHLKVRQKENQSTSRCLAHNLLWQHCWCLWGSLISWSALETGHML
jgi:hypothetical protein